MYSIIRRIELLVDMYFSDSLQFFEIYYIYIYECDIIFNLESFQREIKHFFKRN